MPSKIYKKQKRPGYKDQNKFKLVFFSLGQYFQKKNSRLFLLQLVLFLFAGIIIYRLYYLQHVNHDLYSALAADLHEISFTLKPKRGTIYITDNNDKNNIYPIATNRELSLCYAEPKNIEKPHHVVHILADQLKLDQDKLLDKLKKKNDPFEIIKRKLEDKQVNEIEKHEFKGIGFIKESWRYYPEKSIASHVLGFVGYDKEGKKRGLYGVEGYFENELAGETKNIHSEKNIVGSWVDLGQKSIKSVAEGSDIVLTLDHTLQYVVCNKLKKYVKKYEAQSGSVIVINPNTGQIKAMCNYPDFNPNKYYKVKNSSVFNNPSIYYAYEPGSIFKPITMAMALDMDLIMPNSVYDDKGSVKIGKHIIRNVDYKKYGVQTMTQILEHSINTGAMYVAEKIGRKKFKEYLKNFGFGKKTQIELNYEGKGDISQLNIKGDIYLATSSFGQGITVTPIQMVQAYAAIANGGKLMKPYIVQRVITPGNDVKETSPSIIRQVISPRAATLLGGMLASVVKNGHAKTAGAQGYQVAGKTGTAQISSSNQKGYLEDDTIHSFVGFGPVENPVFTMLVKLDKPKTKEYSAATAAPLFGEIAKFIFEYLNVPKSY
jgi:cell division protein FtsI/penicillin-binding protein 2